MGPNWIMCGGADPNLASTTAAGMARGACKTAGGARLPFAGAAAFWLLLVAFAA